MRIAALILTLAALAACSGPRDLPPAGPSARPSARHVAALADSLAEAASTTPRRAFLERSLRRYGVTPLRDGVGRSRYQVDLGVPIVGGFIPGHHPVGRTDLVVVGTRLDGAGVASLLEAVAVLAERSRWTSQPERSLQVSFWPAGDGVRQALRSSLWPRDAIRAVVMIGPDGPAQVDGIPVVRLAPDADPLALAEALVARVLAEATYAPLPDTLATP